MAYFDSVASRYDELMSENLKFSGLSPDYFDVMKVTLLKELISSRLSPGSSWRLLDFGCGIGKSHPLILNHFPNIQLIGCAVSQESLDLARVTTPSASYVLSGADGHIPLDNPVDVVMIANVFHHIPFEEHRAVLNSIRQVLKPGGLVFLVEHNPLNPLTQYMVKTCPFDEDARLLSSSYTQRLFHNSRFHCHKSGFIVFFPGFMKWAHRFERYLRWCPLGGQHFYLGEAV